jgi:hypothetical protein
MDDAVVFRFGDETEIRHVARIPERGERVNHRGRQWEVATIETRSPGSVRCTLLPIASSPRDDDLATHLLERVEAELDRTAWNLPEPRCSTDT